MNLKQAVEELIECWEEIAQARMSDYTRCESLSKSTHEALLRQVNDANMRVAELNALLATFE